MNEREVKRGLSNAICSKTGRPCRCEVGGGCSRKKGQSSMDEATVASVRWARTSALRLRDAADALEFALDELPFDRPAPAPAWRDKLRRINALILELDKETKA